MKGYDLTNGHQEKTLIESFLVKHVSTKELCEQLLPCFQQSKADCKYFEGLHSKRLPV